MKRKLKICIICYPTHGGSGVVATELGKKLAENGHDLHFISYDIPFRLSGYYENITFHGVDSIEYPLFKYPPYALSLSNKIAQIIDNEKIDIVHAHYAIPHSICGYLGIKISKKENVKLVTTLHGTDISLIGQNESFKYITEFSLKESHRITAVSENLKNETLDLFEVDNKIRVIHNFIDLKEYNVAENEKKFSTKTIIHISNFREVKNIEGIIKIFEKTQKKADCNLMLIGEGPELVKAKRLASELGLVNKVNFMCKQDNVISLLKKSHLFLLPSKKESFGLAALEAMGCGLPVVASNVGGLPEVVDDNIAGFTYNPEDIESMAKGCIELINNDDKRITMGDNAKKIAFNNFSSKDKVRQYENLYYEVLNTK